MVRVDVVSGSQRTTIAEQGKPGFEIDGAVVRSQLNQISGCTLQFPATNTHAKMLVGGIAPVVDVYSDERRVFIGSVASVKRDLFGNIIAECDGALSWLGNIVKNPFHVDNKTHAQYIEAIITQYNDAMTANEQDEKQIGFGGVTGFSGMVNINHDNDYASTLDLLREAVGLYGGFFFENWGGVGALPSVGWMKEPNVSSEQVLEFGVNELSLEDALDFGEFATRVYARNSDGLGITGGCLINHDAEARYGRRDFFYSTQMETQADIDAEASAILTRKSTPIRSVALTAAEIKSLGGNAGSMQMGTTVTALDRSLGFDLELMVNSSERDYIHPENSQIVLGVAETLLTNSIGGSGGGSYSGGHGGISVNLPFVTPEDYGAKGDGVADDTQAIQSALNDGDLVLCADGKTYLVTSSLQINSGTVLDLNGSTFHTDRDIPIIKENQSSAAVSKLVIRNGYLSGTRSNGDGSTFTNQCGIRIRSFQSLYENLRFDNFNYGIYLDARSPATGTLVENRILNSKFANCLNASIYNETGTKVTDGIINNVKIGGSGYEYGVILKQAGGWQISNLHIYGSAFTVGAEFRNCDATLLNNIYIGGNHSKAGLILHDYSHVELSNAVIQANTARTNGLWAQISTSQRWEKKPILLSNVVFSSNAAAGSEIFAIRGGGDIQTVNVIYNDQFGAFVDSRIEPTEQDPSHVVKEAKVDEFGYDIYYPIDNGKELANNKDFNTIVEPGNYIVTKSAVAQSAVNIPEVANGRLVVSNPIGSNGNYQYRRQEYRTYSTTNAIAYERYGTSSDNGTTWNWRPWVAVRDPLSTAVAINSGDNLNNYTNPGAWLVRTSQVAQNTANIPVITPGRLFVMDMLNGYARGESSVYLRQFFVPYSTASGTWTRYGVYSNGSWTWHEWQAEQRAPITVWEVQDVSQGLIALNANITANLAWQLTNLDLTPYKRIKIYAKAGRKTGATAADSSIVPAVIIEMLLDDRAKETVSQNVFIGSAVVQNPNDANRLGMLTCAVSGDKTKFAVTRATSLYGTAATSNTDCYQYVFKIEGYYD